METIRLVDALSWRGACFNSAEGLFTMTISAPETAIAAMVDISVLASIHQSVDESDRSADRANLK